MNNDASQIIEQDYDGNFWNFDDCDLYHSQNTVSPSQPENLDGNCIYNLILFKLICF